LERITQASVQQYGAEDNTSTKGGANNRAMGRGRGKIAIMKAS
jgi:hypothetical protein